MMRNLTTAAEGKNYEMKDKKKLKIKQDEWNPYRSKWKAAIEKGLNILPKKEDNILAKNVSVTGVILGTDGRKMSKNYGNYPDPKEMLQKYWGDALRLYLLGSPVMHAEDIRISAEEYRNQIKDLMLILWNIYNFFWQRDQDR